MKITWLGHSGFRLEIEDQTFLIDPWLEGNPSFPEAQRDEAIEGATAILLSHGHFDHESSVVGIASELAIPVISIFDMSAYFESKGLETIGFNKGGTISIGKVKISMVNACHSSTMSVEGQTRASGSEAGFMISGEGHMIYFSGDTTIMADMEWMGEFYQPDIGILSAGGHFTMDMSMAAWAANRYFNFKTVIPCHYKTFPILEQSADTLKDELKKGEVLAPHVMQTIEI